MKNQDFPDYFELALMQKQILFPYAAIVGQEDFKRALELNLVDRSIGGVLALGEKGAGKTTAVRSLSQLMAKVDPQFNLVNLPIGASEDRVLGTVDLEKLINEKKQELQKGLLSQADGGILYIDEVNLLNDYLTDILLDAAATGGYYLEREGFSLWQESRFCLVGTMNPEEGELRPQLLDRFGLCVDIQTSMELEMRKLITKRRSQFDQDSEHFYSQFSEKENAVRESIFNAKEKLEQIAIDDQLYEYASKICLEYQVEGMRADILLIKAGKANAALNGQDQMSRQDIDQVAPLVLRHRAKDPPKKGNNGQNNEGNDQKDQNQFQEKFQEGSNNANMNPNQQNENEQQNRDTQERQQHFQKKTTTRQLKFSKKNVSHAHRKGLEIVNKIQKLNHSSINKSQQAVNRVESVKNYLIKDKFEVVYKKSREKSKMVIYFLVDSSGSMARHQQIGVVKGIVSNTIANHKGKHIEFAGIGLLNGSATVFQMGTTQSRQMIQQLENFPTGGRTNLSHGFQQINYLLKDRNNQRHHRELYILTDGRVNQGLHENHDPMDEAVTYYWRYLKKINSVSVIDTEKGFIKMGKAAELAYKIKGRYQKIDE